MSVAIRPFRLDELEAVVELSLLAWAPVFESFEQVLGSTIYLRIYPEWRASQRATVEVICGDVEKYTTLVAEIDGRIAGFIVYALNSADKTGEVELLAVHPDYQNDGIGTELNNFALDEMKKSGMRLAVVGTGGDPGHAPARRSYEKAEDPVTVGAVLQGAIGGVGRRSTRRHGDTENGKRDGRGRHGGTARTGGGQARGRCPYNLDCYHHVTAVVSAGRQPDVGTGRRFVAFIGRTARNLWSQALAWADVSRGLQCFV